jgi:hypothetical protein
VAEHRFSASPPRTGSIAGDLVALAAGWRAAAVARAPLLTYAPAAALAAASPGAPQIPQ